MKTLAILTTALLCFSPQAFCQTESTAQLSENFGEKTLLIKQLVEHGANNQKTEKPAISLSLEAYFAGVEGQNLALKKLAPAILEHVASTAPNYQAAIVANNLSWGFPAFTSDEEASNKLFAGLSRLYQSDLKYNQLLSKLERQMFENIAKGNTTEQELRIFRQNVMIVTMEKLVEIYAYGDLGLLGVTIGYNVVAPDKPSKKPVQ